MTTKTQQQPTTVAIVTVPSGAVHVHAYQCPDLNRSPAYRRADISTVTVVNTREAIVTDWFADIIAENEADWTHYAGDVQVFPCVALAGSA